MSKVILLISGYKGLKFLEKFGTQITAVISYNTLGNDKYFEKITHWCINNHIPFFSRSDILDTIFHNADYILAIGWQYLLHDYREKTIVFHDSYVPLLKGFCPTVTALTNKFRFLGATSFRPTDRVDDGPVFYRSKIDISYPITIKDAFDMVVEEYVKMANNIISNKLEPKEIEYAEQESFSIWRDEEDYIIDWTKSIDEIITLVNSLSYPFDGAVTKYNGYKIFVNTITEGQNLNFVGRESHLGKIWKISNGIPSIVCRDGILEIKKAVDENLRRRMGK
jgi:methionyl-tRNA formyltransferase